MPDRERLPFTALSNKVVDRHIIQFGPGKPEVLRDVEIGGPGDAADRRLTFSVEQLEHLLDVAKSSLTQRVTVHHFGVRLIVLRNKNGHRWVNCVALGIPTPEVPPDVRVGGLPAELADSPGLGDLTRR